MKRISIYLIAVFCFFTAVLPVSAVTEPTTAELCEWLYPVGSYLETSKSPSEFNPNDWGGTWVLETEGLVHVSGGSSYGVSGANSGEASVEINGNTYTSIGTQDGGNKDALVPAHTHSIPARSATSTTNGAHTHGFAGSKKGSTSGGVNQSRNGGSGQATASAGAHTHSVSTNATTTGSTGEDPTDANMQPYINVYRWHKVA